MHGCRENLFTGKAGECHVFGDLGAYGRKQTRKLNEVFEFYPFAHASELGMVAVLLPIFRVTPAEQM